MYPISWPFKNLISTPFKSDGQIRYDLRDDFTIAGGPGIDGPAVRGPGTREDVGDNISIVDGAAVIDAVGKILYFDEVITRVPGKIYKAELNVDADGDWDVVSVGFDDAKIATPDRHAFQFAAATVLNIIENGTAVAVADFSGQTEIQIIILLWGTGASYYIKFGVGNWLLKYVSALNSTASLFAGIGASGGTPDVNLESHRVPTPLSLQQFKLFDSFTAADGPRANSDDTGPDGQSVPQWTYTGTGTIISNELGVVPVLGSELLTNGDFSTGCGSDWTCGANWSIATGIATHTAGVAGLLSQSVLSVGGWYTTTFDILNHATGGVQAQYGGGTSRGTAYSANGTFTGTNRAVGSIFGLNTSSGYGADNDNVSLKRLTLASLIHGAQITTLDTRAEIKQTTIDDTQQGQVLRLDDPADPQAFVHIYCDRASNNIIVADVTGAINYAVRSITAFTYSAGAKLAVELEGTNYRIYYNEEIVVSGTDISTATGAYVALFATDADSRFNQDSYQVFPYGSNNEYAQFNGL